MRLAITVIFILLGHQAQAQNFDILVAFGQSNANAVGTGTYYDPLQTPEIDGRIFTFGHNGANNLRIVTALQTINARSSECLEGWFAGCPYAADRHAHIVAFARRYVQNDLAPDRNVLLVTAGGGGSSILEWNGKLILEKHPEGPLLYSDMIGRLRYLLSIPGNRLITMHLSIGEADLLYSLRSLHGMSPLLFQSELRELLTKLRADLPSFTLLANRLNQNWLPGDPTKARIENVLSSVVIENGGFIVTTHKLTSNTDSAQHFSALSMRQLGERYYAKWQQINPQSRVTRSQPVPQPTRR